MGQGNLPLAGCAAHVKAFERLGWKHSVTTSGRNPHVIMKKAGHEHHISIPRHTKEVMRGTLAEILKTAGVSEDEYLDAFHKKKKRKVKKQSSSPS